MAFIRSRQVCSDGIQKRLNAFVSQRAPAENWNTFAGQSDPPHGLLKLQTHTELSGLSSQSAHAANAVKDSLRQEERRQSRR